MTAREPSRARVNTTTRRNFLTQATLTIGFVVATKPGRSFAQSHDKVRQMAGISPSSIQELTGFAPNGFIRIPRQGKITLVMPFVEMGQGVYTSAAMMIAEELEVSLDQIELVAAPPNEKLYAHPILKTQMTGASMSTRAGWVPLRKAGAAARMMLVAAAARRWGVPAERCEARRGNIRCIDDGRNAAYGSFVDEAALMSVPLNPKLKSASQFRIIGQSHRRLDTPEKVNGKTIYGIDVRVEGMKVAALSICPYIGGSLVSLTDNGARDVPGVVDVLRIGDAVAVTASHYWAAKKGLEALSINWARPKDPILSSDDIIAGLHAAQNTGKPVPSKNIGQVDKALSDANKTLEAEYQIPLYAHAALEPLVTTVHVHHDKCEIWLGTQAPVDCQTAAAKMLGLSLDKVILHNQLLGGAFGRRLSTEMVVQAVAFARQVPYPVKVMWTREQDIQLDRFKPFYLDRIAAGLGSDGLPTVLTDRVCGPSTFEYYQGGLEEGKLDSDAVEGVSEIPYRIPSRRVDWVRTHTPLQLGWWRGVGPVHNVFVLESFIDECAQSAGRDPVEYRREMLSANPRARNVLDIAAHAAGWGQPLPPRTGRGVSLHQSFGSFVAMVCEAHVTPEGQIRLQRVFVAVDVGQPTNPDGVVSQIEGGVLFGLSASMFNAITVTDGRINQSNFNDYRQLRIHEAPAFEIHVVESRESPGGVGEAGVASAAPALGNAIFAAVGVRVRQLPFVEANLAETGSETKIIGRAVAMGAVSLQSFVGKSAK